MENGFIFMLIMDVDNYKQILSKSLIKIINDKFYKNSTSWHECHY